MKKVMASMSAIFSTSGRNYCACKFRAQFYLDFVGISSAAGDFNAFDAAEASMGILGTQKSIEKASFVEITAKTQTSSRSNSYSNE